MVEFWSARERELAGRHTAPSRVDTTMPRRHVARLPSPGEVAEWLKAADCKSARASVRWFESSPLHHHKIGRFLPFLSDRERLTALLGTFRGALAVSRGFPRFPIGSQSFRATRRIHDETRNSTSASHSGAKGRQVSIQPWNVRNGSKKGH